MKGRFPDFLVIGAMKCGTTSLHEYLSKHPDIFMSTPKELHFFDDANFDPAKIEWYKEQFRSDKKICGSSPQSYSKCHNKYYRGIPERLHQYMPDIKLIYIVRDPIKRITSHVIENYYGEPLHDVEYNIESGHYAKTSMYYMQLSAYLEYFPREQILILSLEDLTAERLKTMNETFRFLGVQELADDSLFDFVANSRESQGFPLWFLRSYFFRAMNKLAPGMMNKLASNTFLKKFIFQKRLEKLLERVDINNYREEIENDVREFRKLTGKQFGQWSI